MQGLTFWTKDSVLVSVTASGLQVVKMPTVIIKLWFSASNGTRERKTNQRDKDMKGKYFHH